MMLVDTHAHIYSDEFNPDLNEMIIRAKDAGITSILMPAIDSGTHEKMLKLEENYPEFCRSMMGIHPCSVKENYLDELKNAQDYFLKRQFIAVGEIGLDFYWDLTYKEEQYDAFHRQIEWALHYDIPIAIHSREAMDECIKVVAEHQQGKLKGVFHCFNGNSQQAQQIIGLGFYLGIGGVLTFKNSGLDKVMKEINLDRIVLETDAPYLAPVPFRGKRNECSYTKIVAQKLADIKEITIEEVAAITTSNAQKLFSF
ncbi:MAG: TatD family hydrolase [Chitinophagaceae bacterium]